jgi:CheY-like chemotaxis protein
MMKNGEIKNLNGLGYARPFQQFQNLMSFRVREILLVSSLYDSFILEEDGHLYEQIITEYIDLNLSHAPGITRVSSGREAVELAQSEKTFDLVIVTMNVGDMSAADFADAFRASGMNTPIVLLTFDRRELALLQPRDQSKFEKVFIWQGDFRILIAIVKFIEDQMNLEADTRLIGVQSIILVEDNIAFYSSYLPLIYTEVLKHHQGLISEGMNMAHKLLRMRARPKILLCSTYEQAMEYYRNYQDCVLGVISDIAFPRNGKKDRQAGVRLAHEIKKSHFDIPILLQSNSSEWKEIAEDLGMSFVLKSSPSLLQKVRDFMTQYFSFGDFRFCLPDGTPVGTASDLRSLEMMLGQIPDESLRYHSERNHFSRWLKARTEFWLAHKLRPQRVSDFATLDELRADLIVTLRNFRQRQGRGLVSDFDARTFDPLSSFARIGTGSMGGKARGLAFIGSLLSRRGLAKKFPGVKVTVPPAVVIDTDTFDLFMDDNDLREFALTCDDDIEIIRRFGEARLPGRLVEQLKEYLGAVCYPLAVRSSSLLEDSRYQPFAGVYGTFMVPNCHRDDAVRLEELCSAVKRVYASTYSHIAKGYMKAAAYRMEEEKMAVIVQRLVGQTHGRRFYPDFSGVARTHNFYPTPPLTASDGIVTIGLGLGKVVAEGERSVRFCPKFPRHIIQFSDTKSALKNSQKWFYALDLEDVDDTSDHSREIVLGRYGLEVAEADGTLAAVASTYSAENNAIYDGIARRGLRLVTFAPILKSEVMPLAEIVKLIMNIGKLGINSPVEIEFAVNYLTPPGDPKEFAFLQIRPLVTTHESETLEVNGRDEEDLVCRSEQVLGNGQIDGIRDIVMVDAEHFDRSRTAEVALEVGRFNAMLMAERRPYLLIGIGRWGSSDPWLGIPVTWDQIAGARVIVESGFEDMVVEPSQGSHFFQNITSFHIGYFTINRDGSDGMIDWAWLKSRRSHDLKKFTRHIRLKQAVTIRMNGHQHKGIILKPGK